MKRKVLSATSLRIFLITVFVLLLILSVGGFYFAQNWLNDQALLLNQNDTTANNETVSPSTISPQALQASAKAAGVFEASDYQTKVRQDLDVYANKTNLSITSVSPATAPTGAPQIAIAGVTTQTLKISLKDPIKSSDLVKFIKGIESNLPVMRIASLKISNGGNTDGSVKLDELIIQVYVKG